MVYENKADWPEKYDIKKLVTIEKDIKKIVTGEKVSVRRNDRYADVDDLTVLNGHLFKVVDIFPQYLKNISEQDARDEGYESLAAYKEAITNIHEAAVWDPDQLVWAHYVKEK